MHTCNTTIKHCKICFLVFHFILILFNLNQFECHTSRQKRDNEKVNQTGQVCGATGLRLNLDLKKMYGKWYPQVSYDLFHHLWHSKENKSSFNGSSCITLELSEGGTANQTMDFMLSYQNEAAKFVGTRLGDETHPGMSKWAVKWPNGEDTLTSFVAAGTDWNTTSSYDWIWTVDCDINGALTTGWTIFSRKKGISNTTVETIMAIVESIEGLNVTNTAHINPQECQE